MPVREATEPHGRARNSWIAAHLQPLNVYLPAVLCTRGPSLPTQRQRVKERHAHGGREGGRVRWANEGEEVSESG
jgi:hypothetical protein